MNEAELITQLELKVEILEEKNRALLEGIKELQQETVERTSTFADYMAVIKKSNDPDESV